MLQKNAKMLNNNNQSLIKRRSEKMYVFGTEPCPLLPVFDADELKKLPAHKPDSVSLPSFIWPVHY